MNVLAMGLIILATWGIQSPRPLIRRVFSNDAYVKLLIIVGALKWYDVPHLHHPLIHLRIDLEDRRSVIRYGVHDR